MVDLINRHRQEAPSENVAVAFLDGYLLLQPGDPELTIEDLFDPSKRLPYGDTPVHITECLDLRPIEWDDLFSGDRW
jgi:hypothetical protein